MARKKIAYKAGDIFAMPVANGQYVFGRILLDVPRQCMQTGLAERYGGLYNVNCLILEGFDLLKNTPEFEAAPTAIKGYAATDEAIADGTFKIVGHQPVDPREVDFPESVFMVRFHTAVFFIKGELQLLLPVDREKAIASGFDISCVIHSLESFGTVILALMGSTNLAGAAVDLPHQDVRFAPPDIREKIYALVNEDLSATPYYDLALKHGFDTTRFFTDALVKEEAEASGRLLEGISWAFDGEKYATLEKFEKALAKYADEIDATLETGEKIHLGAIAILVEYVDEEDEDHELKFVLKPDNGAYFTDIELLYKINKKVTKRLADMDKHFFEGLSLLKNDIPPLYSLNLGS
jgi:hypothetical protein